MTDLIAMGPLNPTYLDPVPADFVAGIPAVGSRGINNTSILVEARGFQMRADATADLGTPSPWYTVGYFTDSAVEELPNWNTGQPGDVTLPSDNNPGSLTSLNGPDGYEFLQVRFTFYLPDGIKATEPGPYIDRWNIRFTHDQ